MSALRKFLRSAAGVNFIAAYFKDTFRKGGKPELFKPDFNYDSLFTGIAKKCFSKYPFGLDPAGQHDIIMDALLATVTPALVQSFDPSKGDPIGYFGRMFQMRVITALQTELGRRKKQKFKPAGDERTDDEYMDSQVAPSDDLQENVNYSQLIQGLTKALQAHPQGHYLVPTFQLLAQGYSAKEVAAQILNPKSGLPVQPSNVTRWLQTIAEVIQDYAKKTDNAELFTILKSCMQTKKHGAVDPIEDQVQTLLDVLHDYKQHSGSTTASSPKKSNSGRQPAGKITTVQVRATPDVLSDHFMASLVLDSQVTQANIDASAKDFMALLDSADDVVEDGNRLYSMSISDADTRSLRPQR